MTSRCLQSAATTATHYCCYTISPAEKRQYYRSSNHKQGEKRASWRSKPSSLTLQVFHPYKFEQLFGHFSDSYNSERSDSSCSSPLFAKRED